jgi:hypothetical protein
LSNYRNPKLLAFAKDAPHCMCCSTPNMGQVVGAHSNKLRHGKGKGIKAHDLVAYLCQLCHDTYDGRIASSLTRDDKDLMFLDAYYASMLWLFQSGRLRIAA